ncbi:MAG: hypothetical protein HZB65_00570, partial [Candidatus Aenigmarchaeota archaeon]|nr:hypothetical protein [Candidatus Aenigmarchaeota archaeon]
NSSQASHNTNSLQASHNTNSSQASHNTNSSQASHDTDSYSPDENNQEFGSSRSHNRHFVITTVVILIAAVALLYFFNGFGIFGITASGASLSKEQCMQLFGEQVETKNILFSEYSNSNGAVKEATIIRDTITKLRIETLNTEEMKCYIKKQSDDSMFAAKGLGSGEYDCDDAKVTYSGRFDGYFILIKENELANTLNIESSGSKPDATGIAEFDESLTELPDKISGSIEMPVNNRFVQEITYTNSKLIYEKELADKSCMTAAELLA